MVFGVSCTCTVTFFYVLLYMVEIFEWEKHARGLNCFVLCATVDAMIVAFDTSDGWIILSLHTRELVLKIIILEKSWVESSHTGRPPRKTIRKYYFGWIFPLIWVYVLFVQPTVQPYGRGRTNTNHKKKQVFFSIVWSNSSGQRENETLPVCFSIQ